MPKNVWTLSFESCVTSNTTVAKIEGKRPNLSIEPLITVVRLIKCSFSNSIYSFANSKSFLLNFSNSGRYCIVEFVEIRVFRSSIDDGFLKKLMKSLCE